MNQQIFFIGFNKSGTSSFHRYFLTKGFRSHHGHGLDNIILANIARDMHPLTDDYEVYSDSTAIQYSYRALAEAYPASRFVLNIREVERWLLSRLNHVDGRYVEFMNLYHRVSMTWQEWAEVWRKEYMEHERNVMGYFHHKPDRFRRFDIESDVFADLIRFLDDGRLDPQDAMPRVKATRKRYFELDGNRIIRL